MKICTPIRERFSNYLDGDLNGHEMQQVAAHLDTCPACRTEFTEWQSMQRALSVAGPAVPPVDMAVRLRVAISHERTRAAQTTWSRMHDRWELFRDNTLRPMAVQVTVATAVVFAGVFAFSVVGAVAAPSSVEAHDTPLAGFSSPHYLYSAQGSLGDLQSSGDTPLTVEAMVNAKGQVYDYRVLSGDISEPERALLREQMLHAVFEPAHAFGVPVRGTLVFTFTGISVHG